MSCGRFFRGLPNIFVCNVPAKTIVLAAAALLCGCANQSAVQLEPNLDPLEPINRPIYRFNDGFDRLLLRPIATGYKKIAPSPVRTGIANFYGNFSYPVVVFNDFLQGKFVQGFADIGRFVVNSTVGVLGFFDPATDVGLRVHREDFGQTMARWGIPAGPYVVIPIIGPSNLRDAAGDVIIAIVNPLPLAAKAASGGVSYSNNQDDIKSLSAGALDPYVVERDSYEQNRRYEVNNGVVPLMDFPQFAEDEEEKKNTR